jgi:DNA-binding transcriptional LysR family regulator
MEWGDLRYFLAVRRAGTLAGAARNLKVEHSTVSRRLAALEEALGARLFLRGPDGFSLTPAGEQVLPHAEAVEAAALSIERKVGADDQRVEGTVRLTTSEVFTGFMVKRLARLRARHPALLVEVLSGNQSLDLGRGEADLALRVMKTTDPDLLVRKVMNVGWSLYAAEDYLARRGAPAGADNLTGHDIIGFDDTMAAVPGAQWLAAHGAGANVVLRGNSIISALNACVVAMGLAVLPCFLADTEPTLRRLDPRVLGSREVWMVVHPDLAALARVRVVMDFIVEVLSEHAALLHG